MNPLPTKCLEFTRTTNLLSEICHRDQAKGTTGTFLIKLLKTRCPMTQICLKQLSSIRKSSLIVTRSKCLELWLLELTLSMKMHKDSRLDKYSCGERCSSRLCWTVLTRRIMNEQTSIARQNSLPQSLITLAKWQIRESFHWMERCNFYAKT